MPPTENLPEVLQSEFLGLTSADWLILAGLWVALAILLIFVRWLLRNRFERLSRKTVNRFDDALATLFKRTRRYFLIVLALYLALRIMAVTGRGVVLVGHLTFVVFMLQVALWANSLVGLYIDRYAERRLDTDAASVTTMQALGFLGRIAIWVVVALIVLANLGIEITPLIAGAGIGGIAIALAVQNILGDLFASMSIVLDKPFVIGDFLNVGGEYLGTVEHVGLKTTRVRSLSGEQIVFSNSDLLNARIRNYKRMFERRVVFKFGVTYQTPKEKLVQIGQWVKEIVERHDQVRFDRAHWSSFGDSALEFEVVYYVLAPEYNLYMDIQQSINLGIMSRFEDEAIEFAYPTQTLFVQRSEADGRREYVE